MRYRPSCILASLALIAGCAVGTSESGSVDDARGPDGADAAAGDGAADGTAQGDASHDDGDTSALDASRDGAADDGGRDAPVDNGSVDAGREASSDGGADAACTATIVLNEVRVESASSGLDQFIELYNPGACA